MIKYKSNERKVDLYDIGNGLTLMNVIIKNQDGKMAAIDTYIGSDRNRYQYVGRTEGLDEPGVIFSYAKYMRLVEANLPHYIDAYFKNIK